MVGIINITNMKTSSTIIGVFNNSPQNDYPMKYKNKTHKIKRNKFFEKKWSLYLETVFPGVNNYFSLLLQASCISTDLLFIVTHAICYVIGCCIK
jgi:hypothetical protein